MIGIVLSDLVDQNQFNPRQQLCTFTKPEGSTVTEVEFSDPVFYDIQKTLSPWCHNFSRTIIQWWNPTNWTHPHSADIDLIVSRDDHVIFSSIY